jgi:hypothetical protein
MSGQLPHDQPLTVIWVSYQTTQSIVTWLAATSQQDLTQIALDVGHDISTKQVDGQAGPQSAARYMDMHSAVSATMASTASTAVLLNATDIHFSCSNVNCSKAATTRRTATSLHRPQHTCDMTQSRGADHASHAPSSGQHPTDCTMAVDHSPNLPTCRPPAPSAARGTPAHPACQH